MPKTSPAQKGKREREREREIERAVSRGCFHLTRLTLDGGRWQETGVSKSVESPPRNRLSVRRIYDTTNVVGGTA